MGSQNTNGKKSNARTIKLLIAFILLIIAVLGALILNRVLERQTYKLLYPNEIEKWSNQYELDPYLVASIIHVESGNRPVVSSGKGAVGLMQIMPETGAWIAGKLDIEYEVDDLKDAETNIRLGCWYLRFLADRFKVRDTMIAAYNGGHTRISKWLGDSKYSTDGETLKDIPYSETKNYVERVHNAYEKYKKLYPTTLNQ